MKCRSGKHEWMDPVSAQRCCAPEWRRELRYGYSEPQPGDAEDGTVPAGGGMLYVWRRIADDGTADDPRSG